MFLRVLHAISPHLLLVVRSSSMRLGLFAAVLFFCAVRRCGGPRGLGLAPAAIIALGGDELFIEHAALSEALFIFLLSAMLYCAVRALDGGPGWAALAGLCAGLGVWDRIASVAMIAVIALWLTFSAGRPDGGGRSAWAPVSLVVALGEPRRLRGVAPGRLGPERPHDQRQLGAVRPGRAVGGLHESSRRRPVPGRCAKPTPPSQRGMIAAPPITSSTHRRPIGCSDRPTSSPRYPDAMGKLQRWSEAAIDR
jgi:hypothetical protein